MNPTRNMVVVFILLAFGARLSAAEAGPRPGDVYREYALFASGNREWRVTDPAAKPEGARRYLPNPVLKIQVDDLGGAVRAEALLDRWGGHPRTTAKRIRFNGGKWITVPELATTPKGHRPELYYSQDNPVVAVPLTDLKVGENTVEGTCGALDNYNWGQWGLYAVRLRIYYDPAKKQAPTGRILSPAAGTTLGENPRIRFEADGPSGVARVDVLAWYDGYDEDGDGVFRGWHESYHQPLRGEPAVLQDHVGTLRRAPYELTWDTRWVPDQEPGTVKLVARIQDSSGLWTVTPVVENLSLVRKGSSVKLYRASEVPERFGVRVGQKASCKIVLPEDADLRGVVEAGLALRTWHGWDGHHLPMRLNGQAMKIGGKNHHHDFDIHLVPASALRKGANVFQIESATEHHMLEVLWPGPALLVRQRKAPAVPGARFDRIRKLIQDQVDRRQIAGAVALVSRRGKPVYFEAIGQADIGAKTPMRPDTIFRIASMTKPITSVAAMMLVEEGRLQLSDPVSRYLPEFKDLRVLAPSEGGKIRSVPAGGAITIHQLLNHTSGLGYGLFGKEPISRMYREAGVSDGLVQTEGTLAQNVQRLARLPLAHEPGTAWEYGLSTDVLGRVVEVISGQPLDRFLRQRIFTPLGMKDTHFFLPKEKRARLAALYRPAMEKKIEKVGEKPVREGALHYSASFHYDGPRTYFSGGAGLVSTATDYARFLQMLLAGGELDGKSLLKPQTVARMTRNQIGEVKMAIGGHGDRFGYGFGVITAEGKGKQVASVGTYSWGGIFHTYFWVDPKEEVIGLLLTQVYPFGHLTLRQDFQRAVYEELRGQGK